MSELTARQTFEIREALKRDAAELLGRMLFEFSHLDVNLGLCVVWTDNGQRINELTRQTVDSSFHKKLDYLSQRVDSAFKKGSKEHSAYTEWIALAHELRNQRNQLVHGRWGIDPIQGHVINLTGLPTSSDQKEVRYSLSELRNVIEDLIRLQTNLSEISERWPL